MNNNKFFGHILGEAGAKALNNTAEILRPIVVPRTIMSWVIMMGDLGYDGPVPGTPDSYISLHKSESGYRGAIKVEDELITFENAALAHVSATLGVSLGVELPEIDDKLKTKDLGALGKSIDLLVKSEFVRKVQEKKLDKSNNDHKGATPPKPPEKPKVDNPASHDNTPGTHGGHQKPQQQSPQERPPKLPPGAKSLPTEPPIERGQKGKGKVKEAKKMYSRNNVPDETPLEPQKIKINKAEMDKVCAKCGDSRFEKGEFKSCACIPELSKSISTEKSPDGVLLVLNRQVSMETLEALVSLLKD